jgi:hypothetical protein
MTAIGLRRLLAAMLVGACAAPAAAQSRAALPKWEVGGVALGVDQQAYPGSDQRVRRALALPYVIYRGDILRADRDGAGFRAFRSRDVELDVSAAAAFGSSANDVAARRGLPTSARWSKPVRGCAGRWPVRASGAACGWTCRCGRCSTWRTGWRTAASCSSRAWCGTAR